MSEELSYYQSHNDYFKAYREEHKDEIKAYKKAYYQSHKDELKACRKRYREEHKDEIKASGKRYREEHKDEIKAHEERYREEHKDEIKAYKKAYYQSHKDELKAYREEHKIQCKIKDVRIGSYKRGLGYSPLNSFFLCSHLHHLHEESNASFCIYIPSFLHNFIPHHPKTGYGMQSINAVALSYWLIDYQFFKDD